VRLVLLPKAHLFVLFDREGGGTLMDKVLPYCIKPTPSFDWMIHWILSILYFNPHINIHFLILSYFSYILRILVWSNIQCLIMCCVNSRVKTYTKENKMLWELIEFELVEQTKLSNKQTHQTTTHRTNELVKLRTQILT